MIEPAVTYDVDASEPASGDLVRLMARLLLSIATPPRTAEARAAGDDASSSKLATAEVFPRPIRQPARGWGETTTAGLRSFQNANE